MAAKKINASYQPIPGRAPASASNDMMYDVWRKPLVSALIGTAVGKAMLLPEQSVLVMGQNISTTVALFAALYGSSLLGELSFNYILPQVSRNNKFQGATALVEPVLVGAANVGVWQLATGGEAAVEKGWFNLLALGGAADLAADYLWFHVLKPWMHTPSL